MRKENIKVSLNLISESNRRIKESLKKHKKLPVEHFIAVNLSQRMIESELHKIRRAMWRTAK